MHKIDNTPKAFLSSAFSFAHIIFALIVSLKGF